MVDNQSWYLLYLELVVEIVEAADGDLQPGDGEEGGQVGGVGRDDDEPEQPPGGRHQPPYGSSLSVLSSMFGSIV